MPRRASPGVRPVEPDPMYGSKLVQQVINKVMVDGKKSTAEKIVYEALDILSRRTSQDPVPALEESIKQITPVLEVRSRRVGGATYQVPVEVPQRRARTLAVRWLVQFARARRGKTMAEPPAGGRPPLLLVVGPSPPPREEAQGPGPEPQRPTHDLERQPPLRPRAHLG